VPPQAVHRVHSVEIHLPERTARLSIGGAIPEVPALRHAGRPDISVQILGRELLEDLQEPRLALWLAFVARRHAQVGGVKQTTVMLMGTSTVTPSVPKLKSHEATSFA